jgi:hypothetical protein
MNVPYRSKLKLKEVKKQCPVWSIAATFLKLMVYVDFPLCFVVTIKMN